MLSDLYRDYKTLCDSNNVPYANETLYWRIFNGDFNISYYKPKKDRCELCVHYENDQGDTKKDLEVQYFKNIEEKDLSRIEKDAHKKALVCNFHEVTHLFFITNPNSIP